MTGYQTVARESQTELTEKKSRFIGRAFPVTSEEEVSEILTRIRKEHHDATHNCWAYRLSPNGSLARYSDDGEPGGTAGMPILNAIAGRELTDVLVIVTRYFGGILLGAGGLTRTYGKSAGMALEAAGITKVLPGVRFILRLSYPMYGKVTGILNGEGIVIENTLFEADIAIIGIIQTQLFDAFSTALNDATDGTAKLTKDGEELFSF